MDSSNQGLNGNYLQYNNTSNFDPGSFFNEVQDFANSNETSQFDPALFDMGDISSFAQQTQQSQHQPQPNYNQPNQPQRQSQSPALQSFKPSQSTYPNQHFGQNVFDSRTMSQSSFDPALLSRPTPSPGAYDRYSFQQPVNYGNQSFDPRFGQFSQQRQTPSPNQAFQSQPNHSPHHYMNVQPRPSQHLGQPPSMQSMSYTFHQNPQMTHHFIDPSMLNASGAGFHSPSSESQQHLQTSPYFSKAGSTIDPRTLQPMPVPGSAQMQQLQGQIPAGNMQGSQPMMQHHLQPLAHTMLPAKISQDGSMGKYLQGKTRKDGAPGSGSDSDDLEVEEPPEPKPAVISIEKPSDLRGKLLFEMVEVVWAPHNKSVSAERVRHGIAEFGETVRGLRDQWKAKNEELKKAEIPNSATAGNAATLKSDVAKHREIMETGVARAVRFGHPTILKRYDFTLENAPMTYPNVSSRVIMAPQTSSYTAREAPSLHLYPYQVLTVVFLRLLNAMPGGWRRKKLFSIALLIPSKCACDAQCIRGNSFHCPVLTIV